MFSLIALAGTVIFNDAPVALYRAGSSLKDQGIELQNWGSGVAKAADELAFEGVESIRITSRNYFQGGVMAFSRPVDLSSKYSDSNNLLRVVFRMVENSNTISGGGGFGGGSGGRGGGGGGNGGDEGGLFLFSAPVTYGNFYGFGFQRGGGGRGGRGGGAEGGGGTGAAPNAPGKVPSFSFLRLVITTTDDLRSEIYVPAGLANPKDRGWREISVPLQGIKGFGRTNKTIKSIALAIDRLSTFYVGDVRVINDPTPIRGDTNYPDPINVALGSEVTFKARGDAGSTILKITWDFDNSDGIQEEAEGWEVKRRFRRPGNYIVTCTFADKYGLKQAHTSTVKVKVNP